MFQLLLSLAVLTLSDAEKWQFLLSRALLSTEKPQERERVKSIKNSALLGFSIYFAQKYNLFYKRP